jgi:hypothetical protein
MTSQFGERTDFGAQLGPVSFQAVVNASGVATISVAPHGENWRIQSNTVKVSTKVLEARAQSYRGYSVADAYLIEGTFSGSSGDTSNTDIFLTDGQAFTVQWTGADVGAIATLIIMGWRSTPSGGFRTRG